MESTQCNGLQTPYEDCYKLMDQLMFYLLTTQLEIEKYGENLAGITVLEYTGDATTLTELTKNHAQSLIEKMKKAETEQLITKLQCDYDSNTETEKLIAKVKQDFLSPWNFDNSALNTARYQILDIFGGLIPIIDGLDIYYKNEIVNKFGSQFVSIYLKYFGDESSLLKTL